MVNIRNLESMCRKEDYIEEYKPHCEQVRSFSTATNSLDQTPSSEHSNFSVN